MILVKAVGTVPSAYPLVQRGSLCLGHMIYKLNLELKISTNPPIKKRDCMTRKSVGISDLSLHCPFLSYIPP